MSKIVVAQAEAINTSEAATRWNADRKTVADWCKKEFVPGATKPDGFRWSIPSTTKRPLDRKLQRELLWQLLECKSGLLQSIDLSIWGISDSDITGYLSALMSVNLIRPCTVDGESQIQSLDELQISALGFKLLGRNAVDSLAEFPEALLWVAETAGVFAGSFVRTIAGMSA